jgi:hypothetical protein
MSNGYDRGYRLSPDERGSLRAGIDVDALERFLAFYPPSDREKMLKEFFTRVPRGAPRTFLAGISDPGMQTLLDAVYAPGRRELPREVLERVERIDAVRRHPVLIAFVAQVPGRDALALVVRRPAAPRAIILLREDGADARRLAAAVDLLSRDEKGDPDLGVPERRIALLELPALQTAPLDRPRQLLDRLRVAPKRPVEGFGELRAIEYTRIPPDARDPGVR